MANAAQNAPKIQMGKLTPEDAERLASTFRPIWELDDAPFALAQPSALSAEDVDALAGGAGVSPSIRTTEARQDAAALAAEPSTAISVTAELKSFPGYVPPLDAPKVEIAIEPEPQKPLAAAVAPAVAQPTVPRKPYTSPNAPAPTVRMQRDPGGSGEFVPVKKSNVGLIAAGVGVVVVIGAIFGIRAAMSSDTKTAATPSAATTTQEETTHIPPPPDTTTVAATAATANVGTQAPAQTVQQPAQTAAPAQTTQASNTTSHSNVTTNVSVPVHTQPVHTTHTASAGTHPASGGHTTIVRDNPF